MRTRLFLFSLLSLLLLLSAQSGFAFSAAIPVDNSGDPGTITLNGPDITYHTKSGDTLSAIAAQLTTRSGNWVELGRLNQINKDTSIPIGTAIMIPSRLLPNETNSGRIVAFSGQIRGTAANGKELLITLGTMLYEGAQLETASNSFLTLMLADQSRVSIPSNSRIKLSTLRMARYTKTPRTEIMLLQGRVESQVTPMKPGAGRFEVRSPLSVTGVRGTHFRVTLTDHEIHNEVLSGSVKSSQQPPRNSIMLARAQGNVVDQNGVGAAIDLLAPPQLAANIPSTEGGTLRVDLQPMSNASAYQVQIATDAEARNIIAEVRSDSPQLHIAGLRSGLYFARVSVLDQHGLEGLAGTQRIVAMPGPVPATAATAATPATLNTAILNAPMVDPSDREKLTLRWHAVPGQISLLQIAHDPGFTWLLLSESTDVTQARVPRPRFGTYYARVQSIDANGNSSRFSQVQAFIVTDQWIIHDGVPFDGNQKNARYGR